MLSALVVDSCSGRVFGSLVGLSDDDCTFLAESSFGLADGSVSLELLFCFLSWLDAEILSALVVDCCSGRVFGSLAFSGVGNF